MGQVTGSETYGQVTGRMWCGSIFALGARPHNFGARMSKFLVGVWSVVSCVCVLDGRVDNQLHVCVSDSALSRDVFVNDYHCLGDNENRPVKWLAFEALVTRNFSAASDMVCLPTALHSFLRLTTKHVSKVIWQKAASPSSTSCHP